MTKEDIVSEVTSRSGVPKSRVARTLDQFLAEITEALARNERVELRRFGTFEVIQRRSRVARDLNTNRQIQLPDRGMPRFTAFDALRELVASGEEPVDHEAGNGVTGSQREPEEDAIGIPEEDTGSAPESAEQSRADDLENRCALIDLYTGQKRFDEAREQIQEALSIYGSHPEMVFRSASILERIGADRRALQEYEQTLHSDPDHIGALLGRGRLNAGQGRYTEAEMDFRRVLELAPSSAHGFYELGNLFAHRGLYLRAVQEFEHAVELDPMFAEAFFHLGKTYDHVERLDDAMRMFETLIEIQPENERAYWYLGKLYDKKKMGDKALRMYQTANRLSTERKGN